MRDAHLAHFYWSVGIIAFTYTYKGDLAEKICYLLCLYQFKKKRRESFEKEVNLISILHKMVGKKIRAVKLRVNSRHTVDFQQLEWSSWLQGLLQTKRDPNQMTFAI